MSLDHVRLSLIKAAPIYKMIAPSPWMLARGRNVKIARLAFKFSKKAIDLYSGVPSYKIAGDITSEFVINNGLNEFRNTIVDIHAQVYYGLPRYVDVQLDPGGNPYYYKDENGKELFRVSRRPGGGFILYRLPELLNSNGNRIFVTEGEKDVNILFRNGITATTNPAGAGKWKDEYSSYLKDKEVIILPDNDIVGHRHASQVARSVLPYAKQVKIVDLPGLGHKEDVYDWLDRGNTVKDLNNLVSSTPKVSTNTWDLVFYENRSTPQVVKLGELAQPKEGYGEPTHRRATNQWESSQLEKGKWLRVDENGNRPKHPNYKVSTYRPR
ncbi:MAG: hypothetical protein LC687_07735 [Actinobacteria bacterium]|nr:hypothetical protein [Actinomycetota bacterium]